MCEKSRSFVPMLFSGGENVKKRRDRSALRKLLLGPYPPRTESSRRTGSASSFPPPPLLFPSGLYKHTAARKMGELRCDRGQQLVNVELDKQMICNFPRPTSQSVMRTFAMLLQSHLRPAQDTRPPRRSPARRRLVLPRPTQDNKQETPTGTTRCAS